MFVPLNFSSTLIFQTILPLADSIAARSPLAPTRRADRPPPSASPWARRRGRCRTAGRAEPPRPSFRSRRLSRTRSRHAPPACTAARSRLKKRSNRRPRGAPRDGRPPLGQSLSRPFSPEMPTRLTPRPLRPVTETTVENDRRQRQSSRSQQHSPDGARLRSSQAHGDRGSGIGDRGSGIGDRGSAIGDRGYWGSRIRD
jgi:hypothetical protein